MSGTLVAGQATDQLPTVDALPAEHLLDMHIDLEPPQMIATQVGFRATFVAAGGSVDGPKMRADVLPGGGDWLLVGSDSIGRVDVRATLRTDDGVLIHYESRGLIKVPADGLQRLADGDTLPFGDTYVRTTPRFETDDERYTWLVQAVCIGYNVLSPNHIDYRIYKVL